MAGGYIGDPPGKRPPSPLNQTTAAAAGVKRAADLAKRKADEKAKARATLEADLKAKGAIDAQVAADVQRVKREG